MSFDPQALLDLWSRPCSDVARAADAFRELYADPVLINGALLTVVDLVHAAEALQHSLDDVHREVLEVCDAGSKVAVAFRLQGRHVGPLATPAGVLPPTGEPVSIRVIDVLTLVDGLISEITMVAEAPKAAA
ncbi:ester cyclase [Cellulomonas sp. URHE0023]|uniref:ester cyclase n=1 Tax=Cellulomonas sp. URHE0023 TaxID=1380354 RepID=UPI000553DBA0|nr:ester cyclase [Cellulomonas sp. URHE0023]